MDGNSILNPRYIRSELHLASPKGSIKRRFQPMKIRVRYKLPLKFLIYAARTAVCDVMPFHFLA